MIIIIKSRDGKREMPHYQETPESPLRKLDWNNNKEVSEHTNHRYHHDESARQSQIRRSYEWYVRNPEAFKKIQKRYQQRNLEKYRECSRRYYHDHRDHYSFNSRLKTILRRVVHEFQIQSFQQ